jgi:molybdopterin converting factor small subunit
MQVQIRFNGSLAQHIGQARLAIALETGATVAELRQQLVQRHPAAAQALALAVPVLAGRHVTDAEVLHEGQELSLLLPVAGG